MTRKSISGMAVAEALATVVSPASEQVPESPCRLKIGILSDTHLFEKDKTGPLTAAFKYFDKAGVDGVIMCGDLAFTGKISEMKLTADVWNSVFGKENRRSDGGKVEKLFVTGNHDVDGYFYHRPEFPKLKCPLDQASLEDAFVFHRAEVWKELFGEDYKPVSVKEVRGYKFVLHQWFPHLATIPNLDRWFGDDPQKDPQLKDFFDEPNELPRFFVTHGEELKGDKPFFFVQHHNPKETVLGEYSYGGPQGWGEDDYGLSTAYLRWCPNCIAFSGHSHKTLTYERNIWQGAFTAINCSSCASIPFSGTPEGRDNGDVGPKYDNETPKQGLIMNVYDDRIVFERLEFTFGEKLGPDWEIPWPISRGTPYSYSQREAESVAPEFRREDKLMMERKDGEIRLSFPTVRESTHGQRALDYDIVVEGRIAEVNKVALQKRVISKEFGLNEIHDAEPVQVVLKEEDVKKAKCKEYRILVRPCNAWLKKGRALTTGWFTL